MLTLENLKKQLAEKDVLKERTEMIFHQLVGQISLLQSLIKEEEEKDKEQKKPDLPDEQK